MKILTVCENLCYPYAEMVGIKGIYDAQKIMSKKVDITILTNYHNNKNGRLKRWVDTQEKKHNISYEFVSSNNLILRKIKFFNKTIDLLKKNNYDVIHIYTATPFILNFYYIIKRMFKNTKIISSIVTHYGILSSNKLLYPKSIDHLVLNDEHNYEYYKSRNFNSSFIPVSVSKKRFNFKPSYNKKSFLFIGPLRDDKGVISYVEVAISLIKSGYNNLKFEIISYGKNLLDPDYDKSKKKIIEMIKPYRKNFFISEGITNIPKAFKRSDIFIYPLNDLKGTLTSPLTLIEAMASARIIVSSDFKGHEKLIKDGFNGFVFKLGEKDSLKNKVIKVLREKNAWKFGLNARRTFLKNFCLENNVNKLLELYKSL